jgi:tetratricopeptide (TPR) repeat protein
VNSSEVSRGLRWQLGELEQASLIRLADSLTELAYVFRHALIHDSAYDSLVRADRRRVHFLAGEALEAVYVGRIQPAELAPQLARHFEEAGEDERALRYYTLAGDTALAVFANPEAVGAFSRALVCAERSGAGSGVWQHLFSARGRALELNSQFTEALANYEAMARRADVSGDQRLALAASVAMGQLYATATTLFDPLRAEPLAEAALAQARALGDEAVEAKILWNQLNLYRLTQRHEAARAAGEQALEIARRLGLKEQEALANNDLIHVYTDLGRWPEVELATAEAQRLWIELGNTAMLADSLSTTAFALTMMGQFELALGKAAEAHSLSVAINNLWGQAYSLAAMGWAYWYTGRPDRAIETTVECIRIGRLAGYLAVQGYDQARLAYIYEELGAANLAQNLASQAEHSGTMMSGVGIGTLAMVQIRLDLRSGGVERAMARLEGIRTAIEHPPHWEEGPLLQAQSEVALAEGEAGRALQVTQAHVARARELGLRPALPVALLGLARALLLAGRAGEARARLEEALGEARGMGAVMQEWNVLYVLGQVEARLGETAAAEGHWSQAREIVSGIAGRIPTGEMRESFLRRDDAGALFARR